MIHEYINTYFNELKRIIDQFDRNQITYAVDLLKKIREEGGRLFILGVGGSAGNASHAVNDFRKIALIETYTPVDNISELTAWTNDQGFEYIFIHWLKISKFNSTDALMIFSVGGGSKTTSHNLVLAMEYAKQIGATIISLVSRDGGAARQLSDAFIHIPVISEERITPHAEECQGIIWHMIVNALKTK